MPQAGAAHDTFWDFASLMPDITHMLMRAMSDRALPRRYRTAQGFGVHTCRFVTADGRSAFVTFRWNRSAGSHSLLWDEVVKIPEELIPVTLVGRMVLNRNPDNFFGAPNFH